MRIHLADFLAGALLSAGGAIALSRIREKPRPERRVSLTTRAAGPARRKVVVVGVGFAGLSALKRLGELVARDPDVEVLAIDRRNYHLFTPLLYQVATGGVEPSMLAYPARTIAREHGFRFEEATVQAVDLTGKRLETDAGPIEFASLIVAPGSVPNFFGMADAEAHSLPLKWINDGIRLRDQIINRFELADREPEPARRRALLTFLIVGGGATGVELAASLSDLIFTTLLPNYPSLDPDEVCLILVEARGTLLPGWNERMSETAAEHLIRHRVQLLLNTAVSQVGEESVELSSGERISTATVVWTAGVRAEPLVDTLPGEKERDGRVRVDQHLELPGYPGVYVVGDAAAVVLPGSQHPLPPTAWAAIGQGRAAAENAVRRLRGEMPRAFWATSPGELVSLGRGAAAADIRGVIFDGAPGWLLRRGVYLTNLVGFRNRLLVALDWAFVVFHHRTIASFTSLAPRVVPAPAVQPTPLRRGVRRAAVASQPEAAPKRRAG